MTLEELIEMLMSERVASVLKENEECHKSEVAVREKILESLADETRQLFEGFAESLAFEEVKDYQCIYRAAFLDGLRLGTGYLDS